MCGGFSPHSPLRGAGFEGALVVEEREGKGKEGMGKVKEGKGLKGWEENTLK